MLGRPIQTGEPLVQNICQLEAALYREWQQLSQQDIRHLTGGMRHRVEPVIQARGGLHPILTFEQYMSSSDSYVTSWKENDNFIVLYELGRSILKMKMYYFQNWPCDIVIKC
jgi:hypothetical protein